MCKEKFINPFTDFREAEIQAYSQEERMAYEQSLKAYRDYNNTISSTEYMGEKWGLEKGCAEGIEEGRNQEREAMALNMLKLDIDVPTISQITHLSLDDIKKLDNRH